MKILDPACGSGNFLYVAIQQLLDLEGQARSFAASPEIAVTFTSRVHPRQLYGIDINFYATELARVSIWIGYLQWMYQNGDSPRSRPILDPLDTIQCRDAILKWADAQGNEIPDYQDGAQCLGHAEWPEADFIIGNPPFLGSKMFRKWGLPDAYIDAIYASFELPNSSDLCCYWFEISRMMIASHSSRIGLLATQGIRGGTNRTVLQRIIDAGDIFMAWSDREWILDGAAVHVSIIGFDGGRQGVRNLNGIPVSSINADLSTGADFSRAVGLDENGGVGFVGSCKKGKFELGWEIAQPFLADVTNVNGCPNADVLRPWFNTRDLTARWRGDWIIDFGFDLGVHDAAAYERPFEYVVTNVKPQRDLVRNKSEREHWWRLARVAPDYRAAIEPLQRYLVTANTSKHHIVTWLCRGMLASHAVVAFGRDDDYMLGALQSSLHELWARHTTTQLREAESGQRYNVSTCFETFPLPWAPGTEPTDNEHHIAISEAAKELNELRERWLNPPEWIEPIEKKVDAFEDFSDVPEEARELLRQSAIMAEAAKDKKLKKRTLTNLYNERPSWLKLAHKKLDEAVIRAYAEVDPDGQWDPVWAKAYEAYGAGEIVIVRREDVKGKRTKANPANVIAAKEAAIVKRKEIDEKILANLLRMNLQRAKAEKQSGKNDQ